MVNQYLRAFVIGSSSFVFLPFFYAVSRFNPKQFNFDYVPYTFLAPIGLGMANLVSLLIAERYNLSPRERFLCISILAPTVVFAIVTLFKLYNYNMNEWIDHIVKLYLMYFFMWNVVVYYLDKYV